jgi:L-2-hydroxyglutarate oxidase LhgO
VTAVRAAVVGGGIIGVAVVWGLLHSGTTATMTLCEKVNELASHQTGRNSGMIPECPFLQQPLLRISNVLRAL